MENAQMTSLSIIEKWKRTEQDLQRFVSIATRVMDAIQKGVFYPNQDNFMCDEKSCGYWHECHKTF